MIINLKNISEKNIKNLLINGDKIVRNINRISKNTKNIIKLNGATYAKLNIDIKSYGSIFNFLNQNYKMNEYYTDEFIKYFIKFMFVNFNDVYYVVYGNISDPIDIKESKLMLTGMYLNKLYLTLTGHVFIEEPDFDMKVILTYTDNKLLIDKFDNWGINLID
ncbi:DL-endopeptidase inhibitor IseA family protein [Clostridium autoethanogenum]|uniref:IseA DL-endopeptidase inhibitor family protein n=1 Tax=Clostridium autoethanogenum DSM 10061 TaxID=1341692 RepID=A0ABM5NZB1_9CLOT|nr:DL-endopeptidase inhibitor IseA family protein [Clostridium autoethanogenum]AGY77961.1 IseA DL-endopeptidase inhibitor family protein [Clostridium autoethanogenum DSM 10061]ALU38095.1 Hypothetical protein CLAU_3668 [Clostridium autoethanogenum DSM 10061]OVY50859.1 hypothetical protein WX72_02020 [Clostridium autoethanogenum]